MDCKKMNRKCKMFFIIIILLTLFNVAMCTNDIVLMEESNICSDAVLKSIERDDGLIKATFITSDISKCVFYVNGTTAKELDIGLLHQITYDAKLELYEGKTTTLINVTKYDCLKQHQAEWIDIRNECVAWILLILLIVIFFFGVPSAMIYSDELADWGKKVIRWPTE